MNVRPTLIGFFFLSQTTSEPISTLPLFPSSVPSAFTAPHTETPSPGVLAYVVVMVVIAVVISGLALTIVCIRRKCKPDGANTGGNSDSVNMEVIPDYVNCPPDSTFEDSTYQSLTPASRDQDETYSTLSQIQHR